MARSKLLRLGDVRTMLGLTNELRELERTPPQLRARFLSRMCETFRAKFCCFAVAPDFCRQHYRLLELGGSLADSERAWLARYAAVEHLRDPLLEPFVRRLPQQRTLAQRDLIERRAWLRSPHFNEYRRVIGVDDCIYSGFPLDGDGCIIGIGIHRELRDRPFAAREQLMIDLIMESLDPLLRRLEDHAPPAPLPPYLARVLRPLLAGEDLKSIARKLGLRLHSVRTYTRSIYRRFGVESRAELMARFVRAGENGA